MKYKLVQLEEPSQEESLPASLLRQAVGTGASLIGGAAKLPFQIYDAAGQLASKLTPEVPGQPQATQEQKQQIARDIQLTPSVSAAGENLAEQVFPKDYLKPKGAVEEFIYNTAGALPAFYAPGGGFINAATRALGSETGRKVAKHLGAEQFGQFIGSVAGAGLAAGLLTPKNLRSLKNKEYDTFTKSIPQKAELPGSINTSKALDKIKNMDLIKQSKDYIQEGLDRIDDWIEKGPVTIDQAWKDKKFIQKIIRETRGLPREARNALQELSSGITKDIVASQAKNPGLAVQSLLDADSVTYGLENLSPIRQFLRKYITPQHGAGVAATEFFGPKVLTEITGGIPAKVYGAGLLGKAITEAVEPALKSKVAASHLLTQTIPQVIGGAKLSEPTKKKPKYKLVNL